MLAGILCGVAASAAPAQARVHHVQLDHDAPLESVGVQRVHCHDFFPCSRLVLRDGGVRRELTGISQRPRYPFHWSVEKVRFVDFTGDGIPEIAWQLETTGGTVSSPSLKGVDGWDGAHVSHLFRFANAGKPPKGYAYVVFVSWKIVPGGAGGLPEIETKESLNHRSDPNCCPSAYRVTRHRWDGQRIAPVQGSSHIEPRR